MELRLRTTKEIHAHLDTVKNSNFAVKSCQHFSLFKGLCTSLNTWDWLFGQRSFCGTYYLDHKWNKCGNLDP